MRAALSPDRIFETLRAGAAGIAATAADLAVLTLLVAGGVVNFVGNRHFAFRAQTGPLVRQAILYTLVEVIALALNGLLYDVTLRAFPGARPAYWLVRLVTSHVVFLAWSFPLWRRVFTAPARA